MEYPIPTWQDPSFLTIWWLSLNVAEILAALVQDYQNISLYRDLMVPYGREQEFLARWKRASPTSPLLETNGHVYDLREPPRSSSQDHISSFRDAEDHPTHELGENNDTLGARIEHDLDELLAVEARKELEEIYGVPVIKIPVFITCLQRFNSIILSFGLNLLLSAAFLRSPLSIPASDITSVPSDVFSYSPLCVTFPVVLCIHTSLASLYNPVILPRIGVHTAAYVGVLVSLMCFFAGLAVWGALS
ncbi:hypothetical protein ID866_3276 [Astraeus odoratus]|nr:hypothetical protein ID866_3276 [Astraeus odoratus]